MHIWNLFCPADFFSMYLQVTFPRTFNNTSNSSEEEFVTRVLFPANNPFPQKRTIKFPRLLKDISFQVHYAEIPDNLSKSVLNHLLLLISSRSVRLPAIPRFASDVKTLGCCRPKLYCILSSQKLVRKIIFCKVKAWALFFGHHSSHFSVFSNLQSNSSLEIRSYLGVLLYQKLVFVSSISTYPQHCLCLFTGLLRVLSVIILNHYDANF